MSLYSHIFATFYDRFLASSERAGMRDIRRELLAAAQGVVTEIGAGTGTNLPHYGNGVSELILTEPEGPMAKRLRAAAVGLPVQNRVIEAPAANLPLEDESADTVVSTLVLCTVDDVEAALEEVARVLKPGGRFLFLEHVRSKDPKVAKWQDRLHRPWRAFGYGCNCNRDTEAAIERSPLKIEEIAHGQVPKAPSIVRPLISGVATHERQSQP